MTAITRIQLPDHITGDTWRGMDFTVAFTDPDGVPASPPDVSGASFLMQLKANAADEVPLVEWSSTDGTITAEIIDNEMLVRIGWADISVDPGIYVFDVQMIDADDFVDTYLPGRMRVIQDVSREVQT